MTTENIVIGTAVLLLSTNLIGFVYSLLVLKTSLFKKYRIQSKPYKKGVLKERLPLYLLNLLILMLFSTSGVYFLAPFFDTGLPSIWVLIFQVLFVFVIDDVWFYFAHRYMHENKFLLKKIHSIHHRAHTPFPLEYLYVHPFEWMIGIIGTFLGYGILLIFMPLNIYAFWLFGLMRNLHEIHIHSDLRIPILKDIPIISPVEDHDKHHERLEGNYASTFRIWDRLLNTTFRENNNEK